MSSYKLVGLFILILIILFGLYNECESHEYVKKRSKWSMSSKERYEHKMRRFCALPMWVLVLVAISLTSALKVHIVPIIHKMHMLYMRSRFMLF